MGLFDHLYHFDWTTRYPLCYYYNDGRYVVFDKYEIDMFGNIYNKKTRRRLSYYKSGVYDMTNVYDFKGKQCGILVARAVVSTFHGNPPSLEHTTEHIDCTNKNNDIVCELTWMCPSGQQRNRIMPEELLTAYIVVRDELEMTIKEWVKYLENEKNPYGREYTETMIKHYVQRKQYGFSYKVYDDLSEETWYHVVNSDNKMGHWEISDRNRIAYVSKFARNVMDASRFGFVGKYPGISINSKMRRLHDLAYEAFYPEEYASKLSHEMILHRYDDKIDFRPCMLYIGNKSDNAIDARDNGCHNGTKTDRMSCMSYIGGVLEKEHESQHAAEKYLKSIGYLKASFSKIGMVLQNKRKTAYKRTWTRVD